MTITLKKQLKRFPKLIVFDLDYTLWPEWIDCTYGPPYKYNEETNSVIDKQKEELKLFEHTTRIISFIKSLPDTQIAIASRTHAPEWARKLLSLLRIPELDNITLLEAIDYMEIYPSSKIKHFKALSEKSGIPCHEMLFFDDEQRNREVAKLGVHFVLVDSRTGITPTQFENALDAFEKNAGRKEAGEAYLKAAKLYKTTPEFRFECSKAFENASKCLKRMDAKAAIDALNKAITVDKEACNFRNAAKHHQEIAEIYETEIIDLKGARENWQEAAKLYMADDSRPMINKCLLKVAHFDAQLEEYNLAIEHFEQVATDSIDNPLTKWSNKEYYLKAGLCSLCTNDTVKTHELLTRYCAMDASFETTREFQFLSGILECVENNDHELFTLKVREFDSLTKLDNWKINILLKVRKTLDSNK
ncbi:hypothetical protein G6F36_011029 [Rhizopus arrhizus]|nr:hypothetical protein G6F36_011029 [Rhizopus arrhizus]